MDSMSAFIRGEASRGNRSKVFDWIKAAELIKDTKPSWAGAGLSGDWEYTGGTIYTTDGIPDQADTYVYLASTWATPEIDLDGDVFSCWKWVDETPGWDSKTYWPPEALSILQTSKTLVERLDSARDGDEFGGAILGFMRAVDREREADE